MTHRERFHSLMRFMKTDRIPRMEFASFWDETLARWYKEGLDPAVSGDENLRRHFGLDDFRQFWLSPYTSDCPEPEAHGWPLILDASDYRRIHPMLYPHGPWNGGLLEDAAKRQDAGAAVIWITLEGFFWFPRYLMGIERHLYGFYDQPELIHAINDELSDYHCRLIESLSRTAIPDFMTFAEDLSYNEGPMLSREVFEEFLQPYYRRVIPELRKRGTYCFIDSDGYVKDIIPWFADAGLDGCLPCERNAGNDPVEIRARHPEWLMIGGIEKRLLSGADEPLSEHLNALFALARDGGYIPSVDHQTPPGVSLGQYRRYLSLLREKSLK